MFRNRAGSTQRNFRLVFLTVGIAMLLSACSVPVPLGSLLSELGSNKSGTFDIKNISKSGFDLAPFLGESKSQNLAGPTVGQTTILLDPLDLDGLNPVIDLTNRDEIQSKLVSISMSYKFVLTKIGEYTTNNVTLQPYFAPADNSNVSDSANALGAPIAVNFVDNNQTIEATVELNAEQIKAINARKFRLGFGLTGSITDFNGLIAGLSYDIESLKITNLKVNVNERFPSGENGEVISVASIDTGIVKVNSLTLDYAATIKQSTPIVLKGTATVKLYLAAVSETNLYQDSNLIKSIDVDIAGGTLQGQLSVQNPLVDTVLADNKIRYGVTVEGSGLGIEAVAGNDTAVNFEYEVTKLDGTAGAGL